MFVCLCPGRPKFILNRQKEFFTEESLSTIRRRRELFTYPEEDEDVDNEEEF
jgi:hypothetical protein